MGISAIIKKNFSNPKMLLKERLSASKFSFVLSSLIFFVNYFLVSYQFGYKELFLFVLPFSYIIFLISFIFLTYYVIKSKLYGKLNTAIFLILLLILLGLGAILSTSFLLPENLVPNLV